MARSNKPVIEILEAGFLTTIQDRGRFGVRHLGIPYGGSADYISAHIANQLVGNSCQQSVLECTLIGPVIKFLKPCMIALAGADMGAKLDGALLPSLKVAQVRAGAVLIMGHCTKGVRSYIAIAGGFEGDVFFDSRSTHLAAKIGGYQGNVLGAGAKLYSADSHAPEERGGGSLKNISVGNEKNLKTLMPSFSNEWVLRVVMGPELMHEMTSNRLSKNSAQCSEFESITTDMRHLFFGNCFQVQPESNRMGLRLKRLVKYDLKNQTKKLSHKVDQSLKTASLYSSAVYPGTVQWPIGGEPILLGCDGQTVGGYPRLMQVIDVDIAMIGQIRPMDKVWFRGVSFAEARESKAKRLAYIRTLLPSFDYM